MKTIQCIWKEYGGVVKNILTIKTTRPGTGIALIQKNFMALQLKVSPRKTQKNTMNMKQIESEALDLSEEERAELAQKLILSLDTTSKDNLDEDWLLEAQRRARELDDGLVQPVPADEVRKKAQALLR